MNKRDVVSSLKNCAAGCCASCKFSGPQCHNKLAAEALAVIQQQDMKNRKPKPKAAKKQHSKAAVELADAMIRADNNIDDFQNSGQFGDDF